MDYHKELSSTVVLGEACENSDRDLERYPLEKTPNATIAISNRTPNIFNILSVLFNINTQYHV